MPIYDLGFGIYEPSVGPHLSDSPTRRLDEQEKHETKPLPPQKAEGLGFNPALQLHNSELMRVAV